MEITPQGNYILCRMVPIELPGNLVFAGQPMDPKKPKPCHFEVIKVGPGKLNPETGERIPISFKEGDRLVIHTLAFANQRVMFMEPGMLGGDQFAMVDAGDVVGTETGEVEAMPPEIVRARLMPKAPRN